MKKPRQRYTICPRSRSQEVAESDSEPTDTRPHSLAWSHPYYMASPVYVGPCPSLICVTQQARSAGGMRQVPGGEDPEPSREEAFLELAFLTMGMKTNPGTVDICHLPIITPTGTCHRAQQMALCPQNCPLHHQQLPCGGQTGSLRGLWPAPLADGL